VTVLGIILYRISNPAKHLPYRSQILFVVEAVLWGTPDLQETVMGILQDREVPVFECR
jgi:hypothetical protein